MGLAPALVSAEPGLHQSAASPSTKVSASVAGWTAAGAGAGFGLGLYAGLRAFDDAVNSERKVWTAAILAGTARALVGDLVGRARQSDASRRRAALGPGVRLVGVPGAGEAAGAPFDCPAVLLPEAMADRFHLRPVGVAELVRQEVTRGGEVGGSAPPR